MSVRVLTNTERQTGVCKGYSLHVFNIYTTQYVTVCVCVCMCTYVYEQECEQSKYVFC